MWRILFCQNPFSAILRKKFLWPQSRGWWGGGVKAPLAGPLKKYFFCGFPNAPLVIALLVIVQAWIIRAFENPDAHQYH